MKDDEDKDRSKEEAARESELKAAEKVGEVKQWAKERKEDIKDALS